MKRHLFIGGWLVLVAVAACGPVVVPEPPEGSEEPAMVAEARAKYPRFVDVQTYIVGRSCAPNAGVCHNTNNYPDLHTPGNTLSQVSAFCNVEIPDPLQGWDHCERPGDLLYAGDFSTEIAWAERLAPYRWRVGLKDAPDADLEERPQLYTHDDEVVLEPLPEWGVVLTVPGGALEGELVIGSEQPFIADFVESAIASLIGGDPNRNGVFGGTDPNVPRGALVAPGKLDRSYLWGRITGTVPGSRMPLANEPLSDAEYVAVACWIEGLPDDGSARAEDEIDYDACEFAKAPVAYAVDG